MRVLAVLDPTALKFAPDWRHTSTERRVTAATKRPRSAGIGNPRAAKA
jgi:hypothetical protein